MRSRTSLLLLLLTAPLGASDLPHRAVVVAPLADLRSDQTLPDPGKSDDKQQTQLLRGETVDVLQSSGAWVYVNATEQLEFTTHQKWEGYPGWVQRDALQMGAPGIAHAASWPFGRRKRILRTAEEYIGTTYIWGGLSKTSDAPQARLVGLDCSGLTHIAFRKNGITIPRDSHEQWMKAKPVEPRDLKRGDLIFSGKAAEPVKISHVTLYAGHGQLIEAPQTGMVVRRISVQEKYGKPLSEMHNGIIINDRVIYFGTFLND